MVFSKRPYQAAWAYFLSPVSSKYADKVGDGTGSSTVMAPLFWVARTFPEAPPMLWSVDPEGKETPALKHDLIKMLTRPNQFYTGRILWMATLIDWLVDGNAYWLKIRDRGGQVRELWWAPHWTMCPMGDESTFVTHYAYRPGGTDALSVDPSDVVHFRFGLDGDNPRRGRSPLKSVLREIFTDDEAAAFTASLLGNMGVPGLIISPKDASQAPSTDDVEFTKEYFKTSFTGDRRGEPYIMSGATDVKQFGFSPEQLLLKELRRIPEERVTAVLGVPAIVAGLGAGLDRSTFTNYTEAREAAYEQTIIPSQEILAEEIRFQLLGEFEKDVWDWRFGFDLSRVRVLQEDMNELANRHDKAIRGGWGMVSDGRRAIGLPVDEARDNIFLRPMNYVEVPTDGSPTRPLNQKAALNGNGHANAGDIAELVQTAAT